MPATLPTDADAKHPTISDLASGIVDDAQKWFTQELTLAKSEVEHQWERTKTAASLLVIGSTLALFAGILLSFTAVYALHELAGWARWQGFGLVGLVVAVIAGVVVYRGVLKLEKVKLVPRRAVESIQEVASGEPT